jgi:hypothetical protein
VQFVRHSIEPHCPILSVGAGCPVATSTAGKFTANLLKPNLSKLSFIRSSAAACVSETAGKVITFSGHACSAATITLHLQVWEHFDAFISSPVGLQFGHFVGF